MRADFPSNNICWTWKNVLSDTQYFEYGKKETEWLKSHDPVLGAAIDAIGPIRRAVISDLFMALIHSIVGQQISAKAQATIWNRMLERFTPLTPEAASLYLWAIAGGIYAGFKDYAPKTKPKSESRL
jgi:hypothetical protein